MSKRAEPDRDTTKAYTRVAWCYDALASAYSLGAIDRAKAAHLKYVAKHDRLLYAGAGSGREVTLACRAGAEVVCVEPCRAMANRLKRNTAHYSSNVTIDRRGIQSITPSPCYDLVIAHFFLNVFGPDEMRSVLDHLCGFVRLGGRLIISDFKPSMTGVSLLDRAAKQAYYRPLNRIGRLLGICETHRIYDYAALIDTDRFVIEARADFFSLPGVPAFYETIICQRKKTAPSI